MKSLRLPNTLHAALAAGAVLSLCGALTLYASAQEGHEPSAAEQAHIDAVLNGLSSSSGHNIGEVSIAPDGKRLAWIEGGGIRVAAMGELDKSQPVTAATAAGQPCREEQFAWSPDSRALVFFSDCNTGMASGASASGSGARNALTGQANLYLSHLDGNPAQQITDLHGYAHSPAFSPDGSTVAFLYVKGATRPAGALAAMKPWAGVIGEENIEVQRVAVAQVAVSQPTAPTFATPENLHVYEFDWSPDSKSLAYIAADPPGENNWWVAKLYTEAVGAEPKVVLAPTDVAGPLHGLQIAVPRWSPDGKAIAFIGGLMSDQGSTGGDVWVISAEGGQPHDLTANKPTSPAWMEWNGDKELYVSELAGGDSRLVRLTLHGSLTSPSVSAMASATVFSYPGAVADGRSARSVSSTADRSLFVFTASTSDHPTEIYEAKGGETIAVTSSGEAAGVTQLTHVNDGVEPAWGKSVSLNWTNEGFHVQGWLMLPKDYDPAKKYPMIVEVHGGPGSAVMARWGAGGSLSPAAFSALGYFVLQPNPRGSFGQGEAFTQANRKDFGYGDLRDILAGVDAVLAKYSIDPNRVGITGWSYGGFMSMFAVTQTHRFRAAVSGAGLSDWLSYYGENSIDQWMIPFFGASVYNDPAVYAKSSAINFIKRVRTPTLVVVGDRDGECPAPQSFEFWHALKDLHVPTELVVYPNEGHGFVNPAHTRDVMVRAVDWFDYYMPAGS